MNTIFTYNENIILIFGPRFQAITFKWFINHCSGNSLDFEDLIWRWIDNYNWDCKYWIERLHNEDNDTLPVSVGIY